MNLFKTQRHPFQAPADDVGGAAAGGGAAAPAKPQDAGTKDAGAAGAPADTGKPDAGKGPADGTPDKGVGGSKADAKGDGDKGKGSGDAYDVKLPEGYAPDEKTFTAFKTLAKEKGLTSEQASALVEWQHSLQKDADKAELDAWKAQGSKWTETLKADKDFGGAKYDENRNIALSAVERFGGQPLKDALAKYGIDSMPELVKAFHAVGKAIAEGSSAIDQNPGGGKRELSPSERRTAFYDDMKPAK